MDASKKTLIPRRDLLIKTVPACAAACMGLCGVEKIAGLSTAPAEDRQDVHRFDVPKEMSLSARQLVQRRHSMLLWQILILREELGDEETIRLLKLQSERRAQRGGTARAGRSPDTTWETFTAIFRPPALQDTITHEVVEDTEKVFSLRVTECLHAEEFKLSRMDGEIGHAAFCYGDFHMPGAFNPNFRLERTKTLMQGDDHCDHRYSNDS